MSSKHPRKHSAPQPMFPFFHSVPGADKALIWHLEERLRAAARPSETATLRLNEKDSYQVVLSTQQHGLAPFSKTFPAALVRDPARRPALDRAIDVFLACRP